MSRINRRWFNKRRLLDRKIIVGLLCVAALFVLIFILKDIQFEKQNDDQPVVEVVPEKENEIDKEEVVIIDPNKPMIALTFDDGPGKYTDRLLETLKKHNAKATFFMVGQNVGKYPETIQKMKDLGCDIGNHTMNHRDLVKLSVEDIHVQIETTNDALKNIISASATMVRPPYGSEDSKVRENVPYPLVLWSVDTNDWQTEDANAVVEHILNTVKDGDIVLMHDIYSSTVDAVEIVIPKLIEKGYQIVTVSEMAEARGVALENGKIYARFYP